MDRKKELKQLYKTMKPDMGVFIVRNNFDDKCYLEATSDLKGSINRVQFQLKFNSHINKNLQKDWTDRGAENFVVEILEKLDYDRDESKTDYKEDLAVLKEIWEEKLQKQGIEFY